MPDYPYRVLHNPPHRSDRATVRPWEHDIAAFNVVLGLVLLAEATPFLTLIGAYTLPPVVYGASGALLTVGGALCLAGLQWPRRSISIGWAVERTGCIAAAGGWVTVAIVLVAFDPIMIPGLILSLFMATGFGLRWRLLGLVEDDARGGRRTRRRKAGRA